MQVREPLLDAAELGLGGAASNAQVWRGTNDHGAMTTLTLNPDGSFQLKEDPPGHKFLFVFHKAIDISVPSLDVVGASLSGPSVQLWYMPLRNPSSKAPVRQLRKTPPLQLPSPIEATAIITAVQQQQPQRRVLAIINPASGRGVAPNSYSKHIKPILQAAGMFLTEATTTAQGHATQIVKKILPSEYDLILSLGGDGTMFEVLQGVLQRPDWELMSQSITLLQIPCGSGNALAASTGLWDVATAAHAAVKGEKTLLDIASVVQVHTQQEEGAVEAGMGAEQQVPVRFFSFLSCTYGMLSCLDIGTEHLRWLGSTRFIVGAIQQIIMQHTFKIKVAYLDADSDNASSNAGVRGGDIQLNIEDSGGSGTPKNGGWHGVNSENVGYGPSLHHFKEFSPIIKNTITPTAAPAPTATTTAAATSASESPASLPLLPPGWHWLSVDKIQLFAACNLPQLDMNFKFAPEATLHSGHFNLIYTTGRSGWSKGLALLTAAENGEHMDLVQQKRLKAYWIEPGSTESTWLVCDGEQVPHQPLYAEVHPGLITTLKAPQF